MTAALACQKTSQHQTSTGLLWACGGNRVTSAFSRSPMCSPHIHSKTACRGASACRWHASYEPTGAERRPSPSAPAKNSATAFAVALFFVMAVGETEARGACRASPPKRRLWRMQRGGDGAAVGDWQGGPAAADRAGHRKRACEASSSPSLHFRHVMGELSPLSLLCSVLSHPASSASNRCYPLQHPKRTRFRPFWGWTGCGPLFLPFFDPQNFRAGFCSLCRYVSQIKAVRDAM